MNQFLTGSLLVIVVRLAAAQPVVRLEEVRRDSAIQQLGAAFMQQKNHVGLSVGIIHNRQTHFYNFGTTAKATNQLPTANTIYEIGSISKTFGSLLLARAVVENRVRLTDDIRQYLDGKYPNLVHAGKPIQLVHLTNWTSGLPDNFPEWIELLRPANRDSLPFWLVAIAKNYTKQDFFNNLHEVKLTNAPGQYRHHSNVAAQLLGYILEEIYHKPFLELVTTQINEPLRMQTRLASDPPSPLVAEGYDGKGHPMPAFTMREMVAAGGLRYSAADLLNYAAYQLDELDKAVELCHQPTLGNLNTQAFALSWSISQTIDSKRRINHSGGTFGFSSFCDLYPAQQTAVVLLANNSDESTQSQLGELSEKIMSVLFGEPAALIALNKGLQKRGYAQAIAVVKTVRKGHPELHLTEDYVNNWGYALANEGKLQEALNIFKLNVSLYPTQWNTYDSLAETYERLRNRKLAIDNYKRSLALNPSNANAIAFLKKISPSKGD